MMILDKNLFLVLRKEKMKEEKLHKNNKIKKTEKKKLMLEN